MNRHDPFAALRAYAARLTDEVDDQAGYLAAARAVAQGPVAGLSWKRRLLAVASACGLFVSGNVGLALASDSAVPGDLLYGLDRTYEAVADALGFDDDHSMERFEEAVVLSHRGNLPRALEVAREGAAGIGNAPGLQKALDALEAAGVEAADLVGIHDEEAELETQHLVGIGRTVSEAARSGASAAELEELQIMFERHADAVLAAIRQAKEVRGIGTGRPGTPPGLDKEKPDKPEQPEDPGKP